MKPMSIAPRVVCGGDMVARKDSCRGASGITSAFIFEVT